MRIRGRRTMVVVAVSMLVVWIGCTPATPRRSFPRYGDWTVFPTLGTTFSETLNGLFEGGNEYYRLSLGAVTIFRTDTNPWQEIHLEDLPSSGELQTGVHAIAARRFCRAWSAQDIVVGANEWYLFRDGRLVAYDSRNYHGGCSFTPVIEPARGELIDSETGIRRWLAESHSTEDEPRLIHYVRGIAYANADRLDIAVQCLESGDASGAEPSNARVLTRPLARPALTGAETLPDDVDETRAREILVEKIERLRRQPETP